MPLVESNEYQSTVAKRVVAETLKQLKKQDVDTLVLGCTHYPLLRPLIQNVMGPGVTLIDSGAETVNDVSQACPKFVPLVESNEYQSTVAKRVVAETLKQLKKQDVDTLVLGCTHYPLLRPLIQNVMGPGVTLIDSGAETVNDVSQACPKFVPLVESNEYQSTVAKRVVAETLKQLKKQGASTLA
ncbi:hypothetical protein WP50_07845 [Lactiplantibacillus plantarum]|nr:hypothetical protein WP50_07845 [Lactiplantibacillus plantarum]